MKSDSPSDPLEVNGRVFNIGGLQRLCHHLDAEIDLRPIVETSEREMNSN